VAHEPQADAASTEHMVDYDRHSQMQDQLVRSNAERLRDLVDQIGPVAPDFVMVDYGCGPGHSAIDTVRPVIEAYRRLDPRGSIVIRHADQRAMIGTRCSRSRSGLTVISAAALAFVPKLRWDRSTRRWQRRARSRSARALPQAIG
jgi:hypothetical protein